MKGGTTQALDRLWRSGYGKVVDLTNFIPDALATGNFKLRPECYVREVTVGPDGRATGVIYIDADGREVVQKANLVILCLGAIESARLMLMSKSPLFPDGIANSSGQVGRNATFHEYLFAVGLFDDEPLYGFAGTYISGGSFEFYETDEKRGHIGGALIGASMVGHPISWAGSSAGPAWGLEAKDWDRRNYNHADEDRQYAARYVRRIEPGGSRSGRRRRLGTAGGADNP